VKSKKIISACLFLALLATACVQTASGPNSGLTSTSVIPSVVAATATSVSETESPLPTPTTVVKSSVSLLPTPATNSQSNIPYYDRQYRLVNTCNDSTCLFAADGSEPPYLIGYVLLWGYYFSVQRAKVNGGTENCDGFVIMDAPKELLSAYEANYAGDASILSRTADGKMVINIGLWNEDEATKAIITASAPEKPIELRVLNGPPIFRGVVSCFSPVSIIRAVKPIDTSELTQVYEITESDNGKTFTYTLTSRFTVVLDNAKHPLSQLKCEPDAIYGYVSNGSSGDASKYPIRYEITRTGKCQMRNGDFQVTIVGAPLQ
jgi:hypothetical protein